MIDQDLSIRELTLDDLALFAVYWFNADAAYLASLGGDHTKLPGKDDFFTYWQSQIDLPIERKLSYCIIWEKNGISIGHSSTRPTQYGKEAYVHVHLWSTEDRKKGIGFALLKLTVPYYFEKLNLQDLYCEPYALNPAPNRLLEKAGFEFINEYDTIPGPSNFPQPVKRWHLSRQKFVQYYKTGV
jgi:RimJ/RimL family protein N-acetyltransferase